MKYKNCGNSTKTFYGVKFKPGEVKFVPGFINSPKFIKVFDSEDSKKTSKTSELLNNTKKKVIKKQTTDLEAVKTDENSKDVTIKESEENNG